MFAYELFFRSKIKKCQTLFPFRRAWTHRRWVCWLTLSSVSLNFFKIFPTPGKPFTGQRWISSLWDRRSQSWPLIRSWRKVCLSRRIRANRGSRHDCQSQVGERSYWGFGTDRRWWRSNTRRRLLLVSAGWCHWCVFFQGSLTVLTHRGSPRDCSKTGRRLPEAPLPWCLGLSEVFRLRESTRKQPASVPALKWWGERWSKDLNSS